MSFPDIIYDSKPGYQEDCLYCTGTGKRDVAEKHFNFRREDGGPQEFWAMSITGRIHMVRIYVFNSSDARYVSQCRTWKFIDMFDDLSEEQVAQVCKNCIAASGHTTQYARVPGLRKQLRDFGVVL